MVPKVEAMMDDTGRIGRSDVVKRVAMAFGRIPMMEDRRTEVLIKIPIVGAMITKIIQDARRRIAILSSATM